MYIGDGMPISICRVAMSSCRSEVERGRQCWIRFSPLGQREIRVELSYSCEQNIIMFKFKLPPKQTSSITPISSINHQANTLNILIYILYQSPFLSFLPAHYFISLSPIIITQFWYQQMSTKTADNIYKYLIIGGSLAASYFLVHYLANRKPTSSKAIPLDTTLTLLKEIKYQVYASCIAFAEGVNAKLKANYPAKDLEVFLRTELAKTYDLKEDLILTKHMVSRDQYEIALKKYKKNQQVEADQVEILKVLEDSVKGQVDLSVPAGAQRFRREELLRVYREVCEEIGVKVWQKLLDNKRNNPGFDSKNDQHFKAAIRELGIYEFKVQFLKEKGLREEWGCPNLVFLKLLEEAKRQNAEVKAEANWIEKGYEVIISKVSSDLDSYDRVKILRLMEDTIAEQKNKGKPASVSATAPVARSQPVNIAPPVAPVQPKKPAVVAKPKKEEDDEFDLEKMMMDELMSRSQEEPKAEKKEEAPIVRSQKVEIQQEEPRVVQIVESVPAEPVEVKVEAVPEPVPEIESRIEPVAQQPPIQEAVPEPVVDHQPEAVVESVPQQIEFVHEEVRPSEPEQRQATVEVHHVEAHQEPVHVHQEPVEAVEVPVHVHHEQEPAQKQEEPHQHPNEEVHQAPHAADVNEEEHRE